MNRFYSIFTFWLMGFLVIFFYSCCGSSGNTTPSSGVGSEQYDPAPSPSQTPNSVKVEEGPPEKFEVVLLCPREDQGRRESWLFPELALCLDSHLYGLFWDKGKIYGWMLEIKPGKYKTRSTGLPCSFRVYEDCRIAWE